MKTFALILPAAGSGSRFGSDKLLADLAGKSVLYRSVSLFASRSDVGAIVLVTSRDRFDSYRKELGALLAPDRLQFVEGGHERYQSVLHGLRHLATLPPVPHFVAIHDAARPLCPKEVIDATFQATTDTTAALPALPEPATLKRRARDGTVEATLDRRNLYQAQTPQCFPFSKLLAAYEQLLQNSQIADLTDDAQVFERTGQKVHLTLGSPLNLKLTTPPDLLLARALLQAQEEPRP